MVRCCLSVKSCVNSQLQLLALGHLPTISLQVSDSTVKFVLDLQ